MLARSRSPRHSLAVNASTGSPRARSAKPKHAASGSNLPVSKYDCIAHSLIDDGYAILEEPRLCAALQEVFAEGRRFFALPEEARRAASQPALIEGYLPMYSEYSVTPERPDLCEGFAVWQRNAASPAVQGWAGETPLHRAMSAVLPDYRASVNAIFAALGRELNPAGAALPDLEASYLQMNYYRPADHQRDLLQDPHEDGHLLTMLRPTASGAEIFVKGAFLRVEIPASSVLLMPGSLLTLMTGGIIQPLIHRVRNDGSTAIRQSLMYFINPTLLGETAPWIENDSNRGISIRTAAIEKSSTFGLPSIEAARIK